MQHYISSSAAESGTSTNFIIKMSIPLQHNRVSLLAASFPKSMHLVATGYNQFQLDATTYTIPIGCYSITELVSALNTACTPSSFSFTRLTSNLTLTTSATSITLNSRWARILGGSTGTTSITSPYTFPNQVNLTLLNSAYVLSSICNDPSSTAWTNCLSHMFVNSDADGSFILYNNVAPRETSKSLSTFVEGSGSHVLYVDAAFRVIDDNGDILDLNGMPIELVLYTWYQPPELYDLVNKLSKFLVSYAQEQRQVRAQGAIGAPNQAPN